MQSKYCHCYHHLPLSLPNLVLHRQAGCTKLPNLTLLACLTIPYVFFMCVCVFTVYPVYAWVNTLSLVCIKSCHNKTDVTFIRWSCKDVSRGRFTKRVCTEPNHWVWCLVLFSKAWISCIQHIQSAYKQCKQKGNTAKGMLDRHFQVNSGHRTMWSHSIAQRQILKITLKSFLISKTKNYFTHLVTENLLNQTNWN